MKWGTECFSVCQQEFIMEDDYNRMTHKRDFIGNQSLSVLYVYHVFLCIFGFLFMSVFFSFCSLLVSFVLFCRVVLVVCLIICSLQKTQIQQCVKIT